VLVSATRLDCRDHRPERTEPRIAEAQTMICKVCGNVAQAAFTRTVLTKYRATYYYCDRCGFLHAADPFWLQEALIMNKRPILITGSHRSGSTWVGQVVATAPSVGYVHEPFNPEHRPGICDAEFDVWFTHIDSENSAQYRPSFERTLAFDYSLRREIIAPASVRERLKAIRDWANFLRFRLLGYRPLLKDPIAVLSAEWLAEEFDAQVVVLIRHPAAFANSILRLQRRHPFTHFLRQPRLMARYLKPYQDQIARAAAEPPDLLSEAALLWNIIHHVILQYRGVRPDWLYIRYEDLARSPVQGFQRILDYLHLPMTRDTERTIRRLSEYNPRTERPDGKQVVRMNSAANVDSWKRRLNPEQVKRMRLQVEHTAKEFYSDNDW
jgi:Sulfotransferase family